jgi:amino acid permease
MSALVWIVMLDLAEMTSYMPIKSLTVPYLVDRFVDKSLALATGTSTLISAIKAMAFTKLITLFIRMELLVRK